MGADGVVDRVVSNQSRLMQGDKMNQSGRTTLFVLVCIAVLTAAYGVGLGVRKIRSAGFKIHISMGDDTEKPVDRPRPKPTPKPAEDGTTAVAAAEPSGQDEPVVEPPEEQQETLTAQAERAGLRAKKERFQNLPEQEQQKILAKKRKFYADKGRGEGKGRGAFQQLSEEDQNTFRAKMEALGAQAKAGEISEEEMRQARRELLEEYGINLRGRGGRRSGARQ